jgi:RimJ/RimL family protein N-acetyltransferase
MELRTITGDDLPLYVRLQCDPVMMAELGGPHPVEDMPHIFQNTLSFVTSGRGWIFKIIPDANSDEAAGIVCIWESAFNDQAINEIGWMVLPGFQGRGLATKAVRAILDKARAEGRWEVVHAFPGLTNAPSNAICQKTGFSLIKACDIDYAGRHLRCNHWQIDLRSAHRP